ncbi:Mitochondrial Rho GTPase 1 [Sarcoptes scabiei]|nr:Mitochondrial Rho GTPase 1 [Sarcoptes scabiei]
MHIEVQIAINFLVSFLYNKLPRRRVNQFAEELERIVTLKFNGHWYPSEPYKGSAFRCIHCNPQLDSSLFREAVKNSGLNLKDVQENLPNELSIWIDPGEVSYRINEKSPVIVLFSSKHNTNQFIDDQLNDQNALDIGLNPEARCFEPISSNLLNRRQIFLRNSPITSSMTSKSSINLQPSSSAIDFAKKSEPITFTTAAFAATKFGSTKPKAQTMKKYSRQSPILMNLTSPNDSIGQAYKMNSRKIPNNLGPRDKSIDYSMIMLTNEENSFNFKPQLDENFYNMVGKISLSNPLIDFRFAGGDNSLSLSFIDEKTAPKFVSPINFNQDSTNTEIDENLSNATYHYLQQPKQQQQPFCSDLSKRNQNDSNHQTMLDLNGSNQIDLSSQQSNHFLPDLDDGSIPILSQQLLREIFNTIPNENSTSSMENSKNGSKSNYESEKSFENNPVYENRSNSSSFACAKDVNTLDLIDCSSTSDRTISWPSSNELSSISTNALINEFDSLSLNSSSSSSLGSVSSCTT